MTEPRTGSRYELEIEDAGAAESKSHDYYEVLPGDLEEADEEDDLVGYVHSWEVGSTVDGPGLRFVGFLTGCLLRCQYCHNPDTWHKKNGHPVTVSRAMQQIGKYVKVLKISKGGVTLSGGEPMLQRRSRCASSAAARRSACTRAWTPRGAWATSSATRS
jgi:pyruvate formate lyase activating enzyme